MPELSLCLYSIAMPTIPALTIQNKSTQPCQVYIEPMARDYTLLHNDEGEIFQLDPSLGPAPDEPLTIVIHEDGMTLFAFYDYEVQVNGEEADCGFQRPSDYFPSIYFERWLPASPEHLYEAWTNAETLSKAFGSLVVESPSKSRISRDFGAYNNTLRWSLSLAKPGVEFYLFWRTDEFPGVISDSHASVKFEESDKGTSLVIWLTGLPINPPKNWQSHWHDYWEEFILAPLDRYFAANEGL